MSNVNQEGNSINCGGLDVPVEERFEWGGSALLAALREAEKLKDAYQKGAIFALVGIARAIEANALTTWRLAAAIQDLREVTEREVVEGE